MYIWSKSSERRLLTCCPEIIIICNQVLRILDCTVVCGYRGEEEQQEAVQDGTSEVYFPNSNHNIMPSNAVDLMACPIDWHDDDRNIYFGGIVMGVAGGLGIKMRWGHDWNNDFVPDKKGLVDMPHFERILD